MTIEEKIQLNRDRQKAVRDAWNRERNLVLKGKGTVDWTQEQQKELISRGRVSGYEGQHMKSVKEYPQYASSVDNIQLLSHEDHLKAHNCCSIDNKRGYQSPTNGFYDTKTETIRSFGDGPPKSPKVFELSNNYVKDCDSISRNCTQKTQTKSNYKQMQYEREVS